jgi:hypothetical protein
MPSNKQAFLLHYNRVLSFSLQVTVPPVGLLPGNGVN